MVDFENIIETWAKNYIEKDLNLEIIDVYKKTNLSLVNNQFISQVKYINLCDFTCDFTFLVKSQALELILINKAESISLVDIGELVTYSRICDPLASFIISKHGFSSEVSVPLSNPKLTDNLFKFGEKSIIGFQLSQHKINKDSILPISKREKFL